MRKTIPAGLLALGVLSVVWVPSAQSVDQATIDQAIARGVVALKAMQQDGGKWPYTEPGATSLAGITLLECGVDAGDKSVAAAAQYVRKEMIGCGKTYSIALAIIFLDLLGDPRDLPLIETLTVHLMAGQGTSGGWGYSCPEISAEEGQRLERVRASSTTELRTKRGGGGDGPRRTARDLTAETQQLLQQLALQPSAGGGGGDNSNTQFATLAMWVGRRSGVPVDAALARIENRFRQTQYEDGGWGYMPTPMIGMPGMKPGAMPPGMGSMMGSTASMTCAGTLGLIVAHGVLADIARERKKAPRDLEKDPQLAKALAALSTAVDFPVGDGGGQIPRAGGRSFYFLWSLERVCVALELEKLNKKDWYQWGAEILLANQQGDGSWQGEYGASGADTCFALLFLKKANLIRDLTGSLKGKMKDPSEAILKAGGVGGSGLKAKASPIKLKPAIEAHSKPEPERTRPSDTKPPEVRPLEPKGSDASPSARLAGELLKAAPAEQGAILQKLQETRGVENTEALAFAIPRLEGEVKQKAREALTARLTRLKADSLARYLEDEEPEIRRAAALACAAKGLKTAIPKLIPRLRDRDEGVARAVHAALKELSGQDLGTAPADWEAWWAKQAKE